MKVLVLLSSLVLLCSAAPSLEQVRCDSETLSHLAVQHINKHHAHGYKFRHHKTIGISAAGSLSQCIAKIKLELRETKCHVVNPKHFEDCEIREDFDRVNAHHQEVMATCDVEILVDKNEAEVRKYECNTQQVKTDMEMLMMCPDCSKLIPLHSPTSVKVVNETVKEFNKNTSNQHYYILHEVGRMKAGYMMMTGMVYHAEIVLVETHCPMGSRIVLEACMPLCPDRANTTALSPGETPVCRLAQSPHLCPPPHGTDHGPPHHAGGHGPPPHGPPPHGTGYGLPPHAGGHGPPPHAGGHGPPPHGPPPHGTGYGLPPHAGGHGPPPHAGGHGPPPHGPPPHAGGHGPPPHAGGHGPPPHPGSHGLPPHAGGHGPPPHGPPPHAGGHGPPPHGPPPHAGGHGLPPHPGSHGHSRGPPPSQEKLHLCPRCNTPTSFDPTLHPICPWP
ncbi:hypothetical protein PAMP_024954 [Pampus punctatissimus]